MIVDGVELLRMIRDGELKDGTKIKHEKEELVYEYNNLKIIDSDGDEDDFFDIYNLLVLKDNFEIISKENEEEIDIQAIEGVNGFKLIEAPYMAKCLSEGNFDTFTDLLKQSELELMNKIEEVIKAIKQLDKKIK